MCQTSTDGRSMRYSGVRTTVVVAQSSGAVIGYTIFFRHENAVCLTQCKTHNALSKSSTVRRVARHLLEQRASCKYQAEAQSEGHSNGPRTYLHSIHVRDDLIRRFANEALGPHLW